jgi:hypothetical protein
MALDQVVKRVNETGYAYIGNIPEEYIKQITKYCEINKQVRYWNPHKNCEAVERICHNNIVVEIARRYLGVEPILWLSQLIWSFPPSDDRLDFNKSIYREPVKYDPNKFHYDAIDFKSLTLFVYLTDVDSDYSAHTVVEGTHVNKTFKEINNIILDDKVVEEKFGDRIKVISGKRGTAFIEETSAYHKVEICKDRRLILSIDYVLRRQVPPERPSKVTGHGEDITPQP